MKTLFLINGIVTILISILLVRGFLKHYKKEHINKVTNWFSTIFFGYLILSILSILWALGFLTYDGNDFILIYSFVIIIQTLLLFKVAYSFESNERIIYLLYFYLLSLISMPFLTSYFPLFFLIISYFLILVISFNFMFTFEICKRMGYLGIIYSGVSLIFTLLLLFSIGEAFLFSSISNFIFLFFTFYFLKDVERYPIKFVEKKASEKEHYILLFMKYFIFIIVLANFVLISTVGVHELSHVLVSRFYDCDSKSIFYQQGEYPYSEIVCDNLFDKYPITLSGPLIPIIIALALFFLGGNIIKPISLLIIGFNLLASSKDLQEIGVTENIIFTLSIVGLIFLFIGIVLLAKYRMHEHTLKIES
jgi:hypothetical protein